MPSRDSEVSVLEELSSDDIDTDRQALDNAGRAEINESAYSRQGWKDTSASTDMVSRT